MASEILVDDANATDERWDVLTSFLRSSNSAIVITTTAADDYSIVFANLAFEKLTGYNAQEIQGRNCRFLQNQDRSQPERALLRSALSTGESCQCVIRNYTKDGRAFWNRIHIFPLSIDGRVSNFASIQHDASEEKALSNGSKASSQHRDRLIQELHGRRIKMERLSVDLINAQETERQALARELHDELGQRLSTLMMLLHSARPGATPTTEETPMSQAEAEVSHLLRLVRNMSASLRPPSLDLLGLEESIRDLLRRQLHNASAWSFDFSYTGQRLLPAIEMSIFRIIQESVTNIIRHAKASHVVVRVNTQRKDSALKLVVLDNGIGFDSRSWYEHNSRASKFGLVGISERVQLLGGAYKIISKPQHGTRIEVVLPIRVQTPA
jgi:PAS domain S-box-containing protein